MQSSIERDHFDQQNSTMQNSIDNGGISELMQNIRNDTNQSKDNSIMSNNYTFANNNKAGRSFNTQGAVAANPNIQIDLKGCGLKDSDYSPENQP